MNFDRSELDEGIKEIAKYSFSLNSIDERVKCTEWLCKLYEMSSKEEDIHNVNAYIQYLKIMVGVSRIHGPFTHLPPELYLLPLPEYLGKLLRKSIPELAESGDVSPVISHTSSDSRVCLSAQKIPKGGVFFYMAVSPDGL